ncbi:hypothetical protein BDL97_11G054500 [Sphagnum fallax]|nr:hypothetical protein BDL97_11G054500 [Sphagnum fallax]KAH8947663.1 hypothetical protein BDL97_11G054500 [Sphagnum fallax]KAH8947675.1 hypothetical protein BDL97_11G054500 [Sphagnum fallax]
MMNVVQRRSRGEDTSDLAACMCVSKSWRQLAKDDYLWKRLCAQRWPSTCHSQGSSLAIGESRGYHKLFTSFSQKRQRSRPMPAPKLTFHDLEFYVDIWEGTSSVYSAVVNGALVHTQVFNPPAGIWESMQVHLQSQAYKMAVPVSSQFEVCFSEDIHVSLLVRRRDQDRVACIIGKSGFDYVDGPGYRAHAYDYLQISPLYPFVSEIRAWIALLLVDGKCGRMEVFGIELDFTDAANNDNEVLCLLEILDWNLKIQCFFSGFKKSAKVASNSATAEKKWLTTRGFWKRTILLQIPFFRK